ESRQAAALARASLATLTEAAGQQATTALATSTREAGMSEPAHEEEFLATLTQAGVLAAQVARAAAGGGSRGTSPAMSAEIARLRKAGYTEATPYDDLLRDLLGEQRWAKYTRDEARIAAAAVITDAGRAGIYNMEWLLTRAVIRRPWEDDPASPARSVAEILHYRVKTEAAGRHPSIMRQPPTPGQSNADSARTDRGDSPAPPPPPGQHQAQEARPPVPGPRPAQQAGQPKEPMPVTPYDATLRRLLGEDRWRQYADDPRRRDVAALLAKAAAQGRDMDELLTTAVTSRQFEEDPRSSARRVAGVLHYRIEKALAAEPAPQPRPDVPADVSAALSNATAPPGTGPKEPAQATDVAHEARPAFRASSRPPEGRDSR
ncbi:MAG: hypothetical protein J2P25_07190, partial [Nocardiopsaceae bacterium]|nr:hypothetical protein [Nocardiopsaceae bacterium]